MKALAIISQNKSDKENRWYFDKLMSAVAFDLDITFVFKDNGIQQLSENKYWMSLSLYGIDKVFIFQESTRIETKEHAERANNKTVDAAQLQALIAESDMLL